MKSILQANELTTKQMWSKFYLSASMICRIRRMKELEEIPMKNIIKLTWLEMKILSKIINKFFLNWLLSWLNRNYSTCKRKLKERLSSLLYYKFMKEEFGYSYKRINLKPNQINFERIKA